MHKILVVILVLSNTILGFGQQTINGTLSHDEIEREYILYVPESYSEDSPAPLLFNFHGYTSNATQQMWYGDFRSIADTAGFLVVHPEGTLLDGITHWNVGGWTVGSTVDDVGFTEELINAIAGDYNIDLSRVYATGMSNGGFMSMLLACQLGNKIAAIASVTGSMTPQTINGCSPQHFTPVLQIHGTLDPTVPYDGAIWTESVEEVLEYWTDFNECMTIPDITEIENTNLLDLSTVEHHIYSSTEHTATVEHFKVFGGAHTWPGSAITLAGTNYDIDASFEIWKFLSRYDLDGLIVTNEDEAVKESDRLIIYPNPTSQHINLNLSNSKQSNFRILSTTGELLMKGQLTSHNNSIDVSPLVPGLYLLSIAGQTYKIIVL